MVSAKYVKISIDTKGYDDSWIGGNNLLVCYGIVWKVSKNSNVRYLININKFVELAADNSVSMIMPKEYKAEEAARQEWNIQRFVQPAQLNDLLPEKASYYTNSAGNTSMRITSYKATSVPQLDDIDANTSNNEEEEDE